MSKPRRRLRRDTLTAGVYERDELLEKLTDYYLLTGKYPTRNAADRGDGGLPAAAAYKRVFGSWMKALEAWGYLSEEQLRKARTGSRMGFRGHRLKQERQAQLEE